MLGSGSGVFGDIADETIIRQRLYEQGIIAVDPISQFDIIALGSHLHFLLIKFTEGREFCQDEMTLLRKIYSIGYSSLSLVEAVSHPSALAMAARP